MEVASNQYAQKGETCRRTATGDVRDRILNQQEWTGMVIKD